MRGPPSGRPYSGCPGSEFAIESPPCRSRFRPKYKILLECARFGGARLDRLACLLKSADGTTLTRLTRAAVAHGVAPLCYQQILRLDPPAPPHLIAPLERIWLANIYASAQACHELGRLVDACEAAGLPVIPFKGQTLAESAYKEISLRQVGDIDLLIRPSDVPAVSSLLAVLGYLPEQTFSSRQERAFVTLSDVAGSIWLLLAA